MKKDNRIIKYIFCSVILLLAFVVFCSTIWVKRNFEFSGFESMLYTILMPLDGTDPEVVVRGIKKCLILPIILTVISFLVLFFILNRNGQHWYVKVFSFIEKHLVIVTVAFLCISVGYFCYQFKVSDYVIRRLDKTTIYEEKYINPKNVTYEFPDNKRNLVFIYMESMETTYYDKANGGDLNNNLIPELLDLSKIGHTFTPLNNQGFNQAVRAGFTIASNVASSCGLPIGLMFDSNRNFKEDDYLPGAYGLGDVLNANGYTNEYLSGSDAKFASTDKFFKKHGNYAIRDYRYAIENGWIQGEREKMIYEDAELFEIAKKELLRLSKEGKPFNLTISTMDTHCNGYVCDKCENEYEHSFFNVVRCSSKQIGMFVEWIMQQDFYQNTTIVLMGDHQSMGWTMQNTVDANYDRKCYFTIINSANDVPKNNNRVFCTYDIFPTVLSSLGVKFNSDRLAFGTNLYSNTPTLLEEMGSSFYDEIMKSSDYYNKVILGQN